MFLALRHLAFCLILAVPTIASAQFDSVGIPGPSYPSGVIFDFSSDYETDYDGPFREIESVFGEKPAANDPDDSSGGIFGAPDDVIEFEFCLDIDSASNQEFKRFREQLERELLDDGLSGFIDRFDFGRDPGEGGCVFGTIAVWG